MLEKGNMFLEYNKIKLIKGCVNNDRQAQT